MSAKGASAVLNYRRLGGRSTSDHHVYEFIADVRNVGSERVTDFEIRVLFPRAFLNSSTMWSAEDRTKSTPSHVCFSAHTEGRAPGGLYPGDSIRNPLTFDYFVNHDLDDDPRAMQSEIIVELFSGSMKPKKKILPIRDFQDF